MAARTKFQRALELEQAQNWGGALSLFRQVGQVRMTAQVRYHIATCEERLGQLATALGGYRLALEQSEDMPPEFIAEVEGSITDLQARIPKLSIERGPGAEAAMIELDGVALGESSLGVETPLNPGPHTVTATAPGFEDYRETVTVVESGHHVLSVSLVEIKKEVKIEVVPPPPVEAGKKKYGIAPYIIAGTGVVVSVTGGIFLGVSGGKVGKAKDLCGGDTDCDDGDSSTSIEDSVEAGKLADSAKKWEAAGWTFLGVGVAGMAVGGLLYYLDRNVGEASGSAHLSLVPYAPASDAGFSLKGSF